MSILENLLQCRDEKGGGFFLLLDPDRGSMDNILSLSAVAEDSGVDAILVGTSFVLESNFHDAVKEIKSQTNLPVIIFPGAHSQITPHADAILFTSLISGRNPQYLIDEQVKGAPIIKSLGLEPIATGYMLIESGKYTSVQYISGTMPIPATKYDIACAHALAAQYMGMKMVFMEAGSGAENSVSDLMIKKVAGYVDLPIMVGGGIDSPDEVASKIRAGASFVVVGNHFENSHDFEKLKEFAEAAHPMEQIKV
ncbi:MAG: geranylgeranylglyceryl/heptaprenylglyceryl phosphate synthase [Candidatus Zixiibacteriota bacterium]